jgi:argininosuccinate lyase
MNLRDKIQQKDGKSFPGKSFAGNVLEPIFNIQKDNYYLHFINITKAHVIMLSEQSIISDVEKNKILSAINEIEEKDYSHLKYNPQFEDLFFTVEKQLEEMLGSELAGKIHTARSRNDICICEFRMALREKAVIVLEHINELRNVLLALCKEHIETIMPAYTHTQPAQPTTLCHYLLSFSDCLSRDFERFCKAADQVNKSPMGAAAITTTGFPISRERVCDLLNFDSIVENSYDCIAGSDYLMEFAAALMILNTSLSKFIKDILDFCTNEFKAFRLSDPYVQISSIMPQKRNPSSLEHCRPLIGKALGEAKIIFDTQYNTPYGDIVDSEEEIQEHIYMSVNFTSRAINTISNVLGTVEVNKELLLERCKTTFITVTELADTLVRDGGLPFRKAHHLTSVIVKKILSEGLTPNDITADFINEASRVTLGSEIKLSVEDVKRALDPVNFVTIRDIIGGPSPIETRRMLKDRNKKLVYDISSLKDRKEKYIYLKKLK